MQHTHTAAQDKLFANEPIYIFPTSFTTFITHAISSYPTRRIQHALTASLESARAAKLKQDQDAPTRACTNSHANSSSSAVHTSLSTAPAAQLSSKAHCTTNRLRTGTLALPPSLCVCGESTLNPIHVLSCKRLRGNILRHDTLVSLLRSMLREAGYVARTEVLVVEGTSMRMDIVIYLPTEVIWLDASVVNPAKPTYANKNALQARSKEKTGKWKKIADDRGVTFIPLVFETFGAMGPEVIGLLTRIASKAMLNHPYPLGTTGPAWIAQYKAELRVQLAAALAQANHLMIEEGCMRSQHASWTDGQSAQLYSGLRARRVFRPHHLL